MFDKHSIMFKACKKTQVSRMIKFTYKNYINESRAINFVRYAKIGRVNCVAGKANKKEKQEIRDHKIKMSVVDQNNNNERDSTRNPSRTPPASGSRRVPNEFRRANTGRRSEGRRGFVGGAGGRSAFKEETSSLNGAVFQLQDESQFNRTVEAIERYSNKTFDIDLSIFFDKMEMPALSKPVKPEGADVDDVDLDIYREKVKLYAKEEKSMHKTMRALYAIIWGQCLQNVITKLNQYKEEKTWRTQGDCAKLIKAVKEIVMKYDLTKIRTVPGPGLHLRFNGGTMVTNMVGEIPGYGTVWYHTKSLANILSFSNVRKLFGVTMNPNVGPEGANNDDSDTVGMNEEIEANDEEENENEAHEYEINAEQINEVNDNGNINLKHANEGVVTDDEYEENEINNKEINENNEDNNIESNAQRSEEEINENQRSKG